MKNQFKRVLALLLAVVMILGVLPSAFAANVGPFKDVQDNAWYAPYVKAVYENGLMQGVSETKFNPEGTSTRAQVATVLYRIAGQPPVGGPATFTDLTADWYANPVAWAQKNGIVNGLTATKFGPDENVTREQLVVMIHRYFGTPAGTGDLSAFPDADKVSDYAKNAFAWAIGAGIINGSNGKLNPQGLATRAQFAKIIWLAIPDPCEHAWDEGVVTKEPTCVASGTKTFTCTKCGETEKEPVPATGEHTYTEEITQAPTCGSYGIKTLTCTVCGAKVEESIDPTGVHTYENGVCTGCGIRVGKVYTLTGALKDGDEVIIYNAGSGKAMSATMNGFYLAGVDMTATDNKIETGDVSVIWTVKANDDGTYTFLNDGKELGADITTNDNGTFTNIYVENGHKAKWALDTCNAANGSFYISNTELQAKYEKIYLEWYEKKAGFSAYDTSADRLNEAVFGFQFFALDPSEIIDPTVPTDPTDPTDPTEPGEEFVLSSTLKEGDQVVIVAAAKNMALSATYNGYYNAAVEVAPVDGILTAPAEDLVWTVGVEGDAYTFSYNGKKIGMADSYSSMPLGEKNDTWSVLPALTEGAFYLFNLGREVYMEYYESNGNWSGYYNNAAEELFALNFYVKGGTPDPTDPTTEPTTESTSESTTETEPTDPTEPGEDFVLTETLKDGDEVVIVAAAKNMALSSTYNGYYNAAVAVAPVDGILTAPAADIVWTVGVEGDAYTFSYNGQKIGMADSYSSMPLGEKHNTWSVLPALTEGAFYLFNLGREVYMEYYESNGNWSGYYNNAAEELFALNFYVKGATSNPDPEPCNHAWDEGKVTKEPTCTEIGVREFTCTLCNATKTESIPATGEHTYEDGFCTGCGAEDPDNNDVEKPVLPEGYVAIYNVANSIVMTTESSIYNNKEQYLSAAVTLVDGKLTTEATNVALFKLTADDNGMVTFTTKDGKFLEADGTSIRFVDAENDNTKFYLDEVEGGYYIRLANYKYNGTKDQYIEYYTSKGVFTVYGMGADTTMYIFNFYGLAEQGEDPTEPTEPTTEATEPTTEATEPTTEATEPTTEATEPTTETEGEESYVAIYNVANSVVMTNEASIYNNKEQYLSAAATLNGDKLTTAATNVALFKMTTDENGMVTFTTKEGKFLEADGTSIRFVDAENDNTKFFLDEVEGGYYIRLANYKYNGTKDQYIEYYTSKGVFTVYGMGADTTMYIFNFYEVTVEEAEEPTTPPTEPTEPTEPSEEPTTPPTEPTEPTEPGELKEGKYVIAAYVDGKYYAMANVFGTKISGAEITVTDGKVAAADAAAYAIDLIAVADGWAIKGAEGYLSYVSGTNLGTSEEAYSWTITASTVTAGLWNMISTATPARGLLFQLGTGYRFGGYAVSNVGKADYVEVVLLPIE